MSPRAYWKGSLKLSLVTCPIALYPASTQAERTHFHQINTKIGHRLRQQMVDEQTGRVVDKDHKGRGYELSKGKYVEIEEEELDAVKLESTHTIEIDDFVPAEDFDERYLDKPYYVVPNGKAGADAFSTPRRSNSACSRIPLSSGSSTSPRLRMAARPARLCVRPLNNRGTTAALGSQPSSDATSPSLAGRR